MGLLKPETQEGKGLSAIPSRPPGQGRAAEDPVFWLELRFFLADSDGGHQAPIACSMGKGGGLESLGEMRREWKHGLVEEEKIPTQPTHPSRAQTPTFQCIALWVGKFEVDGLKGVYLEG